MIHASDVHILLVVILFSPFLFLRPVESQEDQDRTMKKLQNLLQEEEASSAKSNNPKTNEENDESEPDLEEVRKANRELHGGSSPEATTREKPVEILNNVIEKMDTAARSLETNVQLLRKIKQNFEELNKARSNSSEDTSEKQKKIKKKISELLDKSKQDQQSVSGELKDLISFKKQFSTVKSSQKQSLDNIQKLLKIARKNASKSRSGGGGKKKKRKQKQKKKKQKSSRKQNKKKGKENKPQKQKKQQDQPADKPYEATSEPPENIKTHSTGNSEAWGELPEKVREAILQQRNEEFVPEYGERLRQYYKKLGSDTNAE